jgi:hypothetical protein
MNRHVDHFKILIRNIDDNFWLIEMSWNFETVHDRKRRAHDESPEIPPKCRRPGQSGKIDTNM